MAGSININQNNNDVTIQDQNGKLTITNNSTGTTINVTQPVTSVVTVASLGPKGPTGPAGEIPSTGSFVTTSSFNAFTGSYNTGSFTGSFTGILNGTSSYALTASYLEGYVSPFPFSGSALITGSLTVSGSSTLTNIGPAIFSGSLIVTQGITGSLSGSATTATTASFALTASYVANASSFPYTGSALITGSLGVTGSFSVSSSIGTLLSVSSSQLILNGPGGTAFTPLIALRRNGSNAFYIDEYGSKFNDTVYLNTIYAPSTTGITLGNQSGTGKIIYTVPTQGTFAIGYSTQTTNAALDVKAPGALSTDIALRVRNSADTKSSFEINGLGQGIIRSTSFTPKFSISYVSDAGVDRDAFIFTQNVQNAMGRAWTFDAGYNGAFEGLRIFNDLTGNDQGVFTIQSNNYCFGTSILNSEGSITERRVLRIANGVAPSSSKTDEFKFYSADITAGNAAPHFRTEAGNIVKLYTQAAVTSSQGIADALTNLGLLTGSSIINPTASYATTASYALSALSASYAPTIGPNLGRILFVSTTGNDSTAQIGDISKTYLTIESAVSASTSGDVIHVFQGTYALTTTASAGIAKDGINYYFEPGCTINKATSGSIFNITGFTTGFNVYGYGTFNKTTAVGTILTSVTNAFDFSFEALDISSNIGGCFSLSLNAKTATFKFRHAISSAGTVFTFPGVYFNGDNYDITATSITSTSTNAIVFSQGIGRINLKADLVKSTTSVTISGVYYTTANFNINYCLGVTYGYYIYGISPTTITGYTTGIYNANSVSTTFNGTAENLLNTHGTFTGGLIITPTINGGAATFTWYANYYNTLTVSAGIAYVTAAHNNQYSAPVNVTGGKLYLTGNINGGVNANYSTFTVNGATAELIFNGNYMFASGNKYQSPVYAFHLINGTLRLTGNVENKIVNSSLATCVLYQSGSLILDGVSLRTINPEVPPIIVSTGARNLRTYSGGMTTNRTENGGTYAAKSKKYKYTVTAVASTSITLNDGSGGNEIFTEANTAVYNTTALLAQRMAALINASATLDITATQDTPGTDTYFYTTADVAGIPFTTPAYTNLTELGIRENSYLLTELIGGTIIENSNII